MKTNKRLVYVLLVIALAAGILSGMKPLLTFYLRSVRGMDSVDAATVASFVWVISLIINPLLLFIASFRLGRNLDVQAELRTTIVSIYIGCFVGSFIGWQLGNSIMEYAVHKGAFNVQFNILFNILWGATTSLGSAIGMFFVSFSAISITSFLKYNAKPKNEASDAHAS